MKRMKKLFAHIACLTLAVCLTSGLVACGSGETEPGKWVTPEIPPEQIVNPPVAEARVYSVTLQYNDKDIDGGVLSVDKSAGSIKVSTYVAKDNDADGTVTYVSSDKAVATVAKDGTVTLLKKGETVLTATVGNKSHSVVLAVSDDHVAAPSVHNITVNGGTASILKAAAGEYVTLDVNIPEHMAFTDWRFPNSVTWINGNVFKMPDKDVEIVAEFTDMLYTLNIVGAKITQVDGEEAADGEDGGYTNDGTTADYAITTYGITYGSTIDVEAIEEPAGKIFVGWDYGSQDNRRGDLGVTEYSFEMPDETLTVWAIFGELKTKVLTAQGVDGMAASTPINNGVLPGEAEADPALEGLSGYRMTIGAGATYNTNGYTTENIRGSDLNSITTGTRYMKAIFRNNSEGAVTVEVYASYYGILATSGRVRVEGGETKTVYFTAGMGIDQPWMGFAVRENEAKSSVTLDMVLGSAPMYPKGDKSLAVSGGPQYVKLTDASQDFIRKAGSTDPFTTNGWNRERTLANKMGAIYVACYANSGCYKSGMSETNPTYLSAPIVNMPAFDAANPKGVIYAKYLNLALNPEVSITTTLKVVVSTSTNPADAVATYDINSTSIGDVQMFKLEWDRTAEQNYYLCLVKEKLDATGTYDANSFCLQMVYNNCIGYEEA